MGILDPLYNLLGTGPGAFVYHLLILLALEGAAGIALVEYRHTRNPDQRRFLIAFTVVLLLRVPLLVLGPQGYNFLAPLLYALEVASLTVMSWAFLSPSDRTAGRTVVPDHSVNGDSGCYPPVLPSLVSSGPLCPLL